MTSTGIVAGVFEFPPFTYECDDPVVPGSPYCGIEVTIMKAVADALKMELVLQTPSDGKHHWGSFYANGTAEGLISDILYGVVDIGAGEFFNRVRKNKILDPSDFYNYDYFCFLLKTPPPVPEWVQLTKPFEPMVWMWTCICLLVTIVFLLIYSKVTGYVNNACLKGLSFYINQSTKIDVRMGSIKIFVFLISFCGLVLSLAYSGNLVSFLTVRSYPEPPQMIADLLHMPGMMWGTTGYSDHKEFAESTNPQMRQLAEKFSILHEWQEGFERSQGGNFAFLNSLISSDYAIRSRFTNSLGISEMYVMNECWNIQQIVFYFPKNTKLKEPFDDVLRRLRESGLISKWISDEMDKLSKLQESARLDTKETKLSLDHLRAPFLLALILYGVTPLVFLGELVKKHYGNMFC